MERKNQTVLFGGAFNPPTLAHQAILQACIDYAEPRRAEVWLLPSANRKDKTIEAQREQRLELLEALLKDVICRTVEVKVCTMELDRNTETETYATVQELQAKHPDRKFIWVFGSDSIASMPMWSNGEWLQRNLAILAVERPGSPLLELGANVSRLLTEKEDISSTEVRHRISVGEPYDRLVGPYVSEVLSR